MVNEQTPEDTESQPVHVTVPCADVLICTVVPAATSG